MSALRQTFYQRNNNKLFYFRDISGKQKEIDLIIESPDSGKVAYEIKLSGGKSNQFPELEIGTYEILSKENAVDLLI